MIFNYSVLITLLYISTVKSNEQSLYKLLRIHPRNIDHLKLVRQLKDEANRLDIDFWTDKLVVNRPVDFMISARHENSILQRLMRSKMDYKVVSGDVQKLIREQKMERTGSRTFSDLLLDESIDGAKPFRLDQYNSYDQMVAHLKKLEANNPNIAAVFSIGSTAEKRPLYVIKIGSPSNRAKNAIWLDAGIHAREWVAPSTAMYIINQLVTRYNFDDDIKKYVDELDWHILPLVNPDGYEYSRTNDSLKIRLWRKNRSPDSYCDGNFCCEGVDLNRNFDFNWNGVGASGYRCDESYAGSGPFSELEARAIRDYLLPRSSNFVAFITLHSYSQVWIYPYGHASSVFPKDIADLHKVAIKAKDAIYRYSRNQTRYTVGTGADTLYPASGESDDWAKHVLGIKYTYLIELRPAEQGPNGFLLDASEIIPCGSETFEGIKMVAEAAISHKRDPLQDSIDNEMVTNFPTSCKNDHERCAWYASLGFCEARPDTRESCRLACRLCEQTR